MINGLYTSASGLLMQQTRLDTISNNLANVNTTGYKKDQAVFTLFRPTDDRIPQEMIRNTSYNKAINSAVMLDDIYTNHENGHLKLTGNKLDIALAQQNAFITVDTPWGLRYTRAGDLTLNFDGDLVTREGFPIVSRQTGGTAPINIPADGELDIDNAGNIYIDGVITDTIQISEFDDMSMLQKVGRNLFAAVDIEPIEAIAPRLQHGYLETSNVNPISEMVNMIDAARGYEIYAKVVQTHDELLSKAATNIAEIR